MICELFVHILFVVLLFEKGLIVNYEPVWLGLLVSNFFKANFDIQTITDY